MFTAEKKSEEPTTARRWDKRLDSNNSPGLYLKPGVYFLNLLETPRLIIETGVYSHVYGFYSRIYGMHVCMHIFLTHVSKTLQAKCSPHTRNECYRSLYKLIARFEAGNTYQFEYGWSKFVRTMWKPFSMSCTAIKLLKNKAVGLLGYQV